MAGVEMIHDCSYYVRRQEFLEALADAATELQLSDEEFESLAALTDELEQMDPSAKSSSWTRSASAARVD